MNLTIIGVPYNLDQLRVGMGRAPDVLLENGLAERLAEQGHVAELEMVSIPPSGEPREQRIGQLAAALAAAVTRARAAGRFPLVLGGDCLVSLGVLAGLGRADETGIVWIDAHGDFNTPEISISGYLGGMPLACATGRGLPDLRAACGLVPIAEQNVALLGARDLDPLEQRALQASAVALVSSAELGADDTLNAALAGIARLAQVYVHVDIDVLDMAEAPGVDFPTSSGLALPQLLQLVRRAAGLGSMAALALTAVNPEKDADGRTARAAQQVICAALA